MLHHRDTLPMASDVQQDSPLTISNPVSDALPLGILVTDEDGKCLYSNAAYQRLCGWSANELAGSYWSSVVHPQDYAMAVEHWNAAVAGKRPFLCETRLQRSDGRVLWTRRNASRLTDGHPRYGFVHTVEDISAYKDNQRARQKAEESLFEEKERAQVTLDSIGDAVLSTDMKGRVSYMNVVAEMLTGFSRDNAVGQPLAEVFRVIDAKTRKTTADPAQRAIDSNAIVALAANTLLVAGDGTELAIEDSAAPIRNRHGVVIGAVIVFHDARLSREATARMAYLAQHDALTGLTNRTAFAERFEQALALAKRHDKQMSLLFIDIDNFKNINDTLGHDSGDSVLKALANTLQACVRVTDIVSRFGGDEFVVLLSEIDLPSQALAVAHKIRKAAASPLMIDGHELRIRISIGVSIYPNDGETIDSLMQQADASMYRIKTRNQRSASPAQLRSAGGPADTPSAPLPGLPGGQSRA